MHDLGENSFCGSAFQLEATSRGTCRKKNHLGQPGKYPWVRGGYLGKARTSQRKNICTFWDVGSSCELCSRRLRVVSAILPIARTVSPEQPSYAQPYTREFKKRDDISCTAVLWLKSSSRCFQKKSLRRRKSLMEKSEDLIYVDLPTLTLFWWPRKFPSRKSSLENPSCQVETVCKDCFAGDSPFANICQIAQGKNMQDAWTPFANMLEDAENVSFPQIQLCWVFTE